MLRKTFNSIKTSVWMDSMPKCVSLCFPTLKESWDRRNKSDYVWVLPNGSEIWIAGLDDDKRVEKILGKEYSSIYFNECSQIDYYPVTVALTRLAEKNSLSKKVYYDANPPDKRSWLYWQFIKKINPTSSEALKNPNNYVSMLMNPKDNLENIDEEYLEMLEALPENERLRFLHGEFIDADDGLVYYSFNQEKHVKQTKKEPGTIFIGRDFNVNPMTCVIFQYYNNTFYIHNEVFLKNSDTYKTDAKLIEMGYRGGVVIPDSTAKNRKTSGKSDIQIMEEHGFIVESTRNPFVTDRVNNINRLFTDSRIIINPKCRHLINDLNKVSWKDNKLDPGPDKMLTHISDALGYGCWFLDPIDKFENTVSMGRTN